MQSVDLVVIAGFVAPPLIGAFIGYLTNKIAIKMLFRPLKAWRVFGIKIPMTPGVIPSKRHLLAQNIGTMVGQHLLTSKEIGTALSREPFQEHLHSLIHQKVNDIFQKDFGPVSSFIPEGFTSYYQIGVALFKRKIAQGLTVFFSGKQAEQVVRDFVVEQIRSMDQQTVNQLISRQSRESLYRMMDRVVDDMLLSSAFQTVLVEQLGQAFRESDLKSTTLQELLPEKMVQQVHDLIQDQVPHMLAELGRQIQKKVVREKIIQGVSGGIDQCIDALGPVGAMAKGFIDMNSIGPIIDSHLMKNEKAIIAWLQQPVIVEQFTSVVFDNLEKLLKSPLGDLLESVDDVSLQEMGGELAQQFSSLLHKKKNDAGQGVFSVCLEGWLEQGEVTFASLSQRFDSKDNDASAFYERV